MSIRGQIERALTASRLVAATLYGAVLFLLLAATWLALADLYGSQQALAETADLLTRLQGHKAAAASGSEMSGSPFLEGPTVTVAGAALLQRLASAVAKAGGTVQSSQVDVLGSAAGMVKAQISCEIEQLGLQQLLYDIEAGMPFLYVDQLDAQVPQAVGANAGVGRMHVQLAVSGHWQGAAK